MSENLPGASRYFGTYTNSVLIFNHNYSSMLGIERVKRPKQELIENFLSGETVDELNEGSDGAPAMSTPIQSTSSAFKHRSTKSRSI